MNKKLIIVIGILCIVVFANAKPAGYQNTDIPQPVTLDAKHDQEIKTLDVSIIPRSVIEDSRCAQDVTCIWAGTVRVSATLTSGMGSTLQTFELNKPITTEAEKITLIDVKPYPVSTQKIKNADYIFTFKIEKR
jgi:hypothetical protein